MLVAYLKSLHHRGLTQRHELVVYGLIFSARRNFHEKFGMQSRGVKPAYVLDLRTRHVRRLRISGQQDKLRADRSKGRETWA